MRFLESTDLLKIEDILPFFPDFVVIDDFKDEICTALEGYSAHIERLKEDMNEATRSAEAIKADIGNLRNRFVVVDAAEKCASCSLPLLTRQFYVFPCQHAFHADCLINEVSQLFTSVSFIPKLTGFAIPTRSRNISVPQLYDECSISSPNFRTLPLPLRLYPVPAVRSKTVENSRPPPSKGSTNFASSSFPMLCCPSLGVRSRERPD